VRAALFITCLVDGVVPQVAKATVRVLERVGVTVEMPWAQTCCGQMRVNTGYPREAIPLVRNHVAAFEGYEAIVVPSGSCTAAIRHQHADVARLAGDDALAAAADAIAARTWELSEFLVDVVGVTDVGAYFPHRVTYHPTCHSLPRGVGQLRQEEPFPVAAASALDDSQLRRNLGHATSTIRAKRAAAVAEVPDWQELRAAGAAIKDDVLAHLDRYLLQLEEQVTARGGTVHWAGDANEANRIVTGLIRATGQTSVVKVKSMATQEIGLNEALAAAGIEATETDLAELIVQLGHDRPSHILVPAIHRNRDQIRDIFLREMPDAPAQLSAEPTELTAAARAHLRRKFLAAQVAISGANFAIAETGTLAVVESEGNGRMCLTLPRTLITVMGIEKILPAWRDLEVFLQLLPRSSTAERMNPYTSMWSGAVEGQEFHLVLLDNGRTATLADPRGRAALRCIRCSACLNVCPVYERTGGHAYGSVYPGPIGAVLSPQLTGVADNPDLPFASTLCGACYDVCPVAIDIPTMLVHLRSRVVDDKLAHHHGPTPEAAAMRTLAWTMSDSRRWTWALRAGHAGRLLGRRYGRIRHLPGPLAAWTSSRDLPRPPRQTFRDWWAERPTREPKAPASPGLRSDGGATREGDASRGAGGEGENRA
jgi:L-lactate dehydrogenase complex protein LldF